MKNTALHSQNLCELIPTRQLIKEAIAQGIRFGHGESEHRIRYLIRLELLPHQVRQRLSYKDPSTEGCLPRYCIDLLKTIQTFKNDHIPLRSALMNRSIAEKRLYYESLATAGKGVLPVSSLVTTITDRRYLVPAVALVIGIIVVSQVVALQIITGLERHSKVAVVPDVIANNVVETQSIQPHPVFLPVSNDIPQAGQHEAALWLYQNRSKDSFPQGSHILYSNFPCPSDRLLLPSNSPFGSPIDTPSVQVLTTTSRLSPCSESPIVLGGVVLTREGLILTQEGIGALAQQGEDQREQVLSGQNAAITGSGAIEPGTIELFIPDFRIVSNSKVFIQLTSPSTTFPVVIEKIQGKGFTVSLNNPQLQRVTFDYWIHQ